MVVMVVCRHEGRGQVELQLRLVLGVGHQRLHIAVVPLNAGGRGLQRRGRQRRRRQATAATSLRLVGACRGCLFRCSFQCRRRPQALHGLSAYATSDQQLCSMAGRFRIRKPHSTASASV